MKIIITQGKESSSSLALSQHSPSPGNTIQSQLAGLREKEEAIDDFEVRMHNLRMAESGRDYLLQTYLDQISDNVQTSPHILPSSLEGVYPCGVPPQHLHTWTESLTKINQVNTDLTTKVGLISILNTHQTCPVLRRRKC